MAEVSRRTVRRLDELVTDQQIDDIVQKYSMGQEVWWQREFVNAQFPIVTPEGHEQMINLPVTHIFLGMRGYLVGPQHYIWYIVTVDGYPAIDKLEETILNALEQMRRNKTRQQNGQ